MLICAKYPLPLQPCVVSSADYSKTIANLGG